jgi:hypothetical protein
MSRVRYVRRRVESKVMGVGGGGNGGGGNYII